MLQPPAFTTATDRVSPEAAAAFFRAQADAVLAAGEAVSVRLEIRPIDAPTPPLTGAERVARVRARGRLQRYENVTDTATDAETPSLPHSPSLAAQKDGSEQKKAEKKPEDQKDIPGTTGARGVTGSECNGNGGGLVTVTHAIVQPRGRTQKAERRKRLAHFVPEDWTIKPRHRTAALGLLLDVEAQAAQFRAYEFGNARSDWDRAFDGWLRRAPEFTRRAVANGGRKTDLQQIMERAARIQAEGANGAK